MRGPHFSTRISLIAKRLLRTVSFLVILALVPVTAFVLSVVSRAEKGILTIAVVCGEENAFYAGAEEADPGISAQEAVDRLKEHSGVLRILAAETEEEAKALVSQGKADGAWIFREGYGDLIRSAGEGSLPVLVDIYEAEENVFLRLAREKLFAAIYPDLSRSVYLSFMRNTVGERDAPDDELLAYYSLSASDQPLVRFAFMDGISDTEETEENYLMLPVRGMLSILIFAAALAAAIFFREDLGKGCFVWLSGAGRSAMGSVYIGLAVLFTQAAVFAALLCTGSFTAFWHEAVLMLFYSLATAAMCDFLRRLLPKAEYLAVLMPLMILLMLGLCPIFLNIRKFRGIANLLPAFHYLHGVNSISHTRTLVIMAFAYLALDLTAMGIETLVRKRN